MTTTAHDDLADISDADLAASRDALSIDVRTDPDRREELEAVERELIRRRRNRKGKR